MAVALPVVQIGRVATSCSMPILGTERSMHYFLDVGFFSRN